MPLYAILYDSGFYPRVSWKSLKHFVSKKWVLEISKHLCVPDVKQIVMRVSQMKRTTKEQFVPSRARVLI